MHNRTVQEMTFDGNAYMIIIPIKSEFLTDYDSYQFEILQRNTENNLILSHQIVGEQTEFTLFQLQINLNEYAHFFAQGDTFDLIIVRKKMNEERHSRIKSNYDHIEFFRTTTTDKQIFYPATTKMGNISFYKREDYFLAKIDEAKLGEGSFLTLKGMFLLPKGKIAIQMDLLVFSEGGGEKRIPVERCEVSDFYQQKIRGNGFHIKVDLSSYMATEQTHQLKFYLCATTDAGEEIQSRRMKINHLQKDFPVTKFYKQGKEKYRVKVKPTNRSKYLAVQVSQYQLLKELKQNLREGWVRVRRSKKLLQLFTLAFRVLGKVLPVDKKLVLFESFHGKQFSDNPRAIYEYLQENFPKYKLFWSFDRRHIGQFAGLDVKRVRRFSFHWLFVMTRARYWVTNARLPQWIPKPGHTVYLQTWHGTPLKRLAADMEEVHMPGTNTEKYKENFAKEAAKWDYLISPNAYSTKIFRRAFLFEKKMIESGYPRNDYLHQANNPVKIAQLKEKLGIAVEKKVILYAPTWRDNQFYRKGKYKFKLELDLEKMRDVFGDEYVIVLRLHYLVSENLDTSDFQGFVYDFSSYEDIRDLYVVADMLITDYSSVFFDYANLKRPILFFVYDIEEYRDNLRGFYFDFEKKAPGPLTRTTDELIEEINRIKKGSFTPNEEFYLRFCYLEDGNTTKRVVDRVFR